MDNVLITNIFWKRTYLFIEYKAPKNDIKLSLVKYKTQTNSDDTKTIVILKKHILETKKLEESDLYRGKINITIAEGRELLEKGKWTICVCDDIENPPKISNHILQNIEDYSRVFRYTKNLNAYVVTFHISSKEPIKLSLYANYMTVNEHPEKRTLSEVFRGKKKLKKRIKSLLGYYARKTLNICYQIFTKLTPKNKTKILFMSQNMDHIRDNMKALDTRLHERNLDKKYKITYNFTNIFDNKKRLFYWLKLVFQIAKSDYIFVDDYVPIFAFLNINPKTTITQLWHAGFGFKLVGFGRFGISGSPRPYESCHRKYTYGVIGNEKLKEIYSEVWGIEKEALLATGMPRLEHFLDKDKIEKQKAEFQRKYPQLAGKRIITFAPTYRGMSQKDAYYDYSKIDFDKLYALCKETNSAVAFGKHHFIKQEIPINEEYRDLIYDMSNYPLNDLFYSTDVLITDYSSSFYDFLLLEKPVLFYVYDKDEYSATRGVHRPIEKVAPGKICTTFDEIIEALKNEDYGKKEKADFLIDKCLTNTKLASDQIIDYVILGERDNEK